MQPRYELIPEQKEPVRHGESMFPLKRYITILSDLVPVVTPHWHEEAELTLITEGHCTYHVHLDTFEAEVGDLLFIPPAELHSCKTDPSVTGIRLVSSTFVFHTDYLGAELTDICSVKYIRPIFNHSIVLPYIIKKGHPVYQQILDIFYEMETVYEKKEPGYEIKLKALLFYTVALLFPFKQKENNRPQLENEHINKLKIILEYIDIHYAEKLTIGQLAQMCFFSEYHFMRFFKKYIGVSCLEYIKNLRLEKAAAQLTQGELSVLDVSMSCGFSNLSYFYREFRKKYGMTPKKYIAEKKKVENK